jgi:hypothetical protein
MALCGGTLLLGSPPLAAAAAQPAAPIAGSGLDGALAGRILAIHNRERGLVGVPPLAWDDRVAAAAAQYARQLAERGRLEHSQRESRGGTGENLARGVVGYHSVESLAELWVAEKSAFRNGTFPDVSTTGSWRAVGHYSAMIWRSTTAVGCGTAGNGRDLYLVCRYAPAGNVIGRRVY